MDQKLLDALNNLSFALQEISDALNNKSETKSPTAEALSSGNFGKQLEEISVGIKSIKDDTKKILDNQETILKLQKEKKSESLDIFSESGDPKKKQSIKDGVGTILLIAGAVLAIGLAFKIVGNVDFLSVIALSTSILIISYAFERISLLGLLPGVAFSTAKVLVIIAGAIAVSSLILSLIVPLTPQKALTSILISATFAVLSRYLPEIFSATLIYKKLNVSPLSLITTLSSISAAITASSLIMQFIAPISIQQGLTAIFISGVFMLISYNLQKIATSVVAFKLTGVRPIDLVLTMLGISTSIMLSSQILRFTEPLSFGQIMTAVSISLMFGIITYNLHKLGAAVVAFKLTGVRTIDLISSLLAISTAITLSSIILKGIMPISFAQGLTAIFISATFMIISFNLEKISIGVIAFKKTGVKPEDLLLTLVGISGAITASSWIMSMIVPISFAQALTVIFIALVFSLISYVMPELAIGLAIMKKFVSEKDFYLIPKLFLSITTAIALSSFIFSLVVPISPGKMLSITIMSVGISVAVLAMGITLIALNMRKSTDYAKGGLSAIIISGVILAISKIISSGTYDDGKLPGLNWGLKVGASILALGLVASVIGLIVSSGAGALALGLGLASIVVIVGTIFLIDKIISSGKYDEGKYPSDKWSKGVVSSIIGFGIAALGLGLISLALIPGSIALLGMSYLIVKVGSILSEGQYEEGKYPNDKWSKGVVSTIKGFGMAALGLGLISLALIPGSIALKGMARTIVKVDSILAEGKYKNPPPVSWSDGVGKAISAFNPVYKLLMESSWLRIGISKNMKNAIVSISEGIVAAAEVFYSNSASFNNPPPVAWSEGVGKAIAAFSPVYKVLYENAKWFGGSDVSVKDMKRAIITISEGIKEAAIIFNEVKTEFKNPPPYTWAKNVGKAISAFSPVYKVLAETSAFYKEGISAKDMKNAVIAISESIIESAKIFSENKTEFKNEPPYTWAKNVGKSITAFSTVFKTLSETSTWYKDGISAKDMKKAMVIISEGIVEVAKVFSPRKIEDTPSYLNAPPDDWIKSINYSIKAFIPLFSFVKENSGIFGFGISKIKKGIVQIAEAIADVSKNIGKGDYKNYPNTEWAKGVSTSISNLSSIDLDKSSKNDISTMTWIAKYIYLIDHWLNKGFYVKYPNTEWAKGVSTSISKLSSIDLDKSDKNDIARMTWIAKYIYIIDSWLNKGSYTKFPSVNWINSTIYTFTRFKDLLKAIDLSGVGVDTDERLKKMFSGDTMKKITSNIELLGISMEKLGKSMTEFNSSIKTLDVNKLEAIRQLSSNVVLLSLMDPDQFDDMMKKLEERGGVFIDIMADFEKKKGEISKTVKPVATPVKKESEMVNLSKKIDRTNALLADMTTVVGSRGTLKNYLNSIKQTQLEKTTK